MSDMNLDLYLMRCLLAQTACLNTACSAFYIMRKIRVSMTYFWSDFGWSFATQCSVMSTHVRHES